MKTNEILEEVYRARQEVLDECGGTLHGLFLRFSGRNPDLTYCELPPRRARKATHARRNPPKHRTTAKHVLQKVKP